MRKEKTIIASFKKIIEQMGISIDVKLLERVHLRMAEYTFRSYTKRKNNDTFNGVKELASDKTNLAFRTIVQTGGKDVKEETDEKQSKQNNQKVMKELGLKKAQSKQVKSKEEVTKSYLGPFNEAMKRLLENENDVEKAKLGKEQCAAVLTLGFNSFTRFGSRKLDHLRADVTVEIAKNYDGKVVPYFWLRQQQMQVEVASKKRKADSPPVDDRSQPAHKRSS